MRALLRELGGKITFTRLHHQKDDLMSAASSQPPNEALTILLRLEPALGKLDDRLDKLDDRIGKLDDRFRALEGEVREMKGRMSGIERQLGQLPTLWTLGGLVVSIFGFAFVLLRFAIPRP